MTPELDILISNFLQENLKSLTQLSQEKGLVNSNPKKYEKYINALKMGVVDYIEFENGQKLTNDKGNIFLDGKKVTEIKLEEASSFSLDNNILTINPKEDKISNAGNTKLEKDIKFLDLKDYKTPITNSNILKNYWTKIDKALDWLVVQINDNKDGVPSYLLDYLKNDNGGEEFIGAIIPSLQVYAQFAVGLRPQYKDLEGNYREVKQKLVIDANVKSKRNGKPANSLLNLSIEDLIDLAKDYETQYNDIVKNEEKKFKTTSEGSGGGSGIQKFFNDILAKKPYYNTNRENVLDYRIPAQIETFGDYLLITYSTIQDALFWSRPSWADWARDYPKGTVRGEWEDEATAIKLLKETTQQEALRLYGTTLQPMVETLGGSWCTADESHVVKYVRDGAVYMIMKDFKKYLQYAPSQNQFEPFDKQGHLSLSNKNDRAIIEELIKNVPPFIEHCIEGGKDEYIDEKHLKSYLDKKGYLPSIKSYLRLYDKGLLTEKEIIDNISSKSVQQHLYQVTEKSREPINPWNKLEDKDLNTLIDIFTNIIKSGDSKEIDKVITIIGYIINGSANSEFKHRFKSGTKAIDFLNSIVSYMLINHPNDSKTKELLDAFGKDVQKKVSEMSPEEEEIAKSIIAFTDNLPSKLDSSKVGIPLILGIIGRNFKELTGQSPSSGNAYYTRIVDVFKEDGVDITTYNSALSDEFMEKDENKEKFNSIGKEIGGLWKTFKEKIFSVRSEMTKISSIKNHRNLLLNSVLKADESSSKPISLDEVERVLRELKLDVNLNNIYIPITDIDYYDLDKDKDLKGLSLIISILNPKHQVVDFSGVNSSTFSVINDLAEKGVVTGKDGKYFLKADQYKYLNSSISKYLKKVFQSSSLRIDDSHFSDVKSKGIAIEKANPLELFLSRMKDKSLNADYKKSLLEIFSESVDEKLVANLSDIISNFYKNVGDYLYEKIDLTEIYNDFVEKYSR